MTSPGSLLRKFGGTSGQSFDESKHPRDHGKFAASGSGDHTSANVAAGLAAGAAAIGGAYALARKGHLGQAVHGLVHEGEMIAGEHAATIGQAASRAAGAGKAATGQFTGAALNAGKSAVDSAGAAIGNTGIGAGFRSGRAEMGVDQARELGGAGAAFGAKVGGAVQQGADSLKQASVAGQRAFGTAASGARSAKAGFKQGFRGKDALEGQRDAYQVGHGLGDAANATMGAAQNTAGRIKASLDGAKQRAATNVGNAVNRAAAGADHAVDTVGRGVQEAGNVANRILNAAKNPASAARGVQERGRDISNSPQSMRFRNTNAGKAYFAGRGTNSPAPVLA